MELQQTGEGDWSVPRATQVARGADNRLWWAYRSPGGAWVGLQPLDGNIVSEPTVVTRDGANFNVYARGADGQLWQKWFAAGVGWGGWSPIGGQPL